jgi:hypothetical protein
MVFANARLEWLRIIKTSSGVFNALVTSRRLANAFINQNARQGTQRALVHWREWFQASLHKALGLD